MLLAAHPRPLPHHQRRPQHFLPTNPTDETRHCPRRNPTYPALHSPLPRKSNPSPAVRAPAASMSSHHCAVSRPSSPPPCRTARLLCDASGPRQSSPGWLCSSRSPVSIHTVHWPARCASNSALRPYSSMRKAWPWPVLRSRPRVLAPGTVFLYSGRKNSKRHRTVVSSSFPSGHRDGPVRECCGDDVKNPVRATNSWFYTTSLP
ncbi:hypothetical protein BC629DRAFT_267699 [Irpex lacteus]|nr:hypothetical protein BC629DRAFT_267699 [Irpex lacteus]